MAGKLVKRTLVGGGVVAALLMGLHVYNHLRLDGGVLDRGVDALVAEARALGAKARPEYQDLALATLPPNPRTGEFVRLDEQLDRAVLKRRPAEVADTGTILQSLEFDDPNALELKAADGALRLEAQNGVLRVVNDPADHLVNAVPLTVPRDEVGDLLIRLKAEKGSYLRLGWSAKGRPPTDGLIWRHKFDLRLDEGGDFHTYVVNARNVLKRGTRPGEQVGQLYLQPSDAPGAAVEIDYIRFLSKAARYAAAPNGVDDETVANELRRAIFMRPDQTLEFAVQVPQAAPRLDLGLGVLLDGRPLRFSVTLTAADGTVTTLHATEIADTTAWRDARLDLGPWAGQAVRLGLAVEGDPGNVAFWSSPMVSGAPKEPFNVIVMIEDAQRADYLSAYGHPVPTTPFKERLMAERGVLFARAIAQADRTRPSVGAYMTSLYPTATGLWHFSDVLSDRHLTLAELLRAQGYVTASFIENGNAGQSAGMHQGFDRLISDLDQTTEDVFTGPRVTRWLEENRDRNFFLYLHAIDPHAVYDPPQPWRDRAMARLPKEGDERVPWDKVLDPAWLKEPTIASRRLLYEAEIAHNDQVVEEFFRRLDAMGLSRNTLVVMTSDHGEYFGERNFFGNRLWSHRPPGFLAGTHVPLMMVYPERFTRPQRIEAPVQLIDVMPTVLELAGVDRGDLLLQGHSLVGLIEGERPEAWRDRVIVSEEPTAMLKGNPCNCGSLHFRDWHLLGSSWTWPGRVLRFPNLQTWLTASTYRVAEDDRSERLAVASLPDLWLRWRHQAALRDLREADMAIWRGLTAGEAGGGTIDPETIEQLRGLGYVN